MIDGPALVAHVVGKNIELYPDMLLIRAADPLGFPMPPGEDRQPTCVPLRQIKSLVTSYYGLLGSKGQLLIRLANGEELSLDFSAHEIELVEQIKLMVEAGLHIA